MAYNLNEYTVDGTQSVSIENYTGTSKYSENKFLNAIANIAINIIRWFTWKTIFWCVFVLVLLALGVNQYKAIQAANEMSDHAASDGWYRVLKDFKKNTNIKSTKINAHPVYKSESIKEWEKEHSLKFSRIYQYILIKNENGDSEDLLVMKKAAFDLETKEKLKLDDSDLIMTDAEDVCDEFLGDLPTNYQKSFYTRNRHWNIRDIKDELTKENNDENNYFRCVINQEKIKDLLDE